MTNIAIVLAGLWTAAIAPPMFGVEPESPALHVAQRAARADAYGKLLSRIGQVRINAAATVKDFLDADERIASGLHARFREAATFGPPRVYTDGAVEVDAHVTLRWLAGAVRGLHTKIYRGDRIKATDVAAMARTDGEQFLVATGAGLIAGGPDAEPDPATSTNRTTPAGWGNVTVQGMVMARRAAELDACRRLAEQVTALRLGNGTVADSLTADEHAEAAFRAFVRKAALGAPQYDTDQVCMVRAAIKVEALIAMLKSLHADHETTDGIRANDFDKIAQAIQEPVVSAVGRGVPPPKYVAKPEGSPAGPSLPEWAKRTLRATGTGTPLGHKAGAKESKRWAAAAAFASAHRKLAEQLDAVRVTPKTTVRDLIETDDYARADIATYLTGVRKVSTKVAEDGAVTVTLELLLERLWHITRHCGSAREVRGR